MDNVGDALKEGGRKAKRSTKSIQQRLEETRTRRKTLETSNKLHSEFRSEKGKLREAKLESFGLGRARRKNIGKVMRKLSKGSRKFKPPRIF